MQLAWVTDAHLEWLSEGPETNHLAIFLKTLSDSETDGIIISGDISTSQQIKYHLKKFAQLPMPVYFVLGNHDIYGSSFDYVHRMVRASVKEHKNLTWLTEAQPIPLTDDTYLIGHDGWADGRAGMGQKSGLLINDYRAISDFRGLSVGSVFSQMQTAADIASRRLAAQIRNIGAKHIIVVTHAPPFLKACLYQGKPTEDNFAPHFSNIRMGERLEKAAANSGARLSILCGHTHDEARVNINNQITVSVGWALYGSPTYTIIDADIGC
jgi:UDP-2,3-diacylglucosamine pyrophosphatase LpxH